MSTYKVIPLNSSTRGRGFASGKKQELLKLQGRDEYQKYRKHTHIQWRTEEGFGGGVQPPPRNSEVLTKSNRNASERKMFSVPIPAS